MLKRTQTPAGPQNAAGFCQRRLRVGNGAQRIGDHDRVGETVGERHAFIVRPKTLQSERHGAVLSFGKRETARLAIKNADIWLPPMARYSKGLEGTQLALGPVSRKTQRTGKRRPWSFVARNH